MSVARTASGEALEVVGSAPSVAGDVTMMTWFRYDGDSGNWGAFVGVGQEPGGYTNFVGPFHGAGGADFYLYHRGTEVGVTGFTYTVGRWYHVAVYGDFAASGNISATLYDPVTDTETTLSGTGGTTGITANRTYFGGDPADEYPDASYQYGKCWERELTLNEIRTERWSGAPIYLQNLWGAWDIFDVNDGGVDRSGNGRDLTYTGVTTRADGPPVSRYPSAIILPFVAPSSGTNIAAATEALTLTTYAASIQLDVNVNTSTEALTLTEFPASVGLDVNIQAGTEALTLNALASSIALDVNVSANTQALTLTEFPSTVSLDVDIQVGTEVLTLTALAATVSLDAGTIINASSVPLALVTNVAVINSTNVVITDVNTTESWADGTNGLVATGTGFV